MSPALQNKDMENMEIIRVGGTTYIKEPFGRDALRRARETNSCGKFIDVMQSTLLRKTEAKRFYF
jgi:hypothetical protein